MKKFTSFMLMLLCAVTTWGQDVFTNDNLKEITPGNYYIYYTDSEDVKHYLQTTGANTFSIVTENPAAYNISVGGGSAFNKAYYIQMNGLCFSNPNPNNNHTLTTGTIGWNAAAYISTVVFENGEGLCALRSTNAPVSTWDENYFITHDESNNVTTTEGSEGGADLFVWTIEEVEYPNELAEFESNKCYTATLKQRGGWAVKDGQFVTYNQAGDVAAEYKQFAILSADGENYYLFNVGANAFVKKDGSTVQGVADPIVLHDASAEGKYRVLVQFKGYSDGYINVNGSINMDICGWNAVDHGNAILFEPAVGEFDSTAALEMLNSAPEVTYKFVHGEKIIATQTTIVNIGDDYPAISVVLPYGTTATIPTEKVTATTTVNLELSISEEIPFEAASDVNNITKWYYVRMHTNEPGFIGDIAEDNTINVAKGKIGSSADTKDNYLWGFAGNVFDGIKVVNKGTSKEITTTGSGNVTLTDEGTSLYIVKTSAPGNLGVTNGFCLRNPESTNYINANYGAGKLSHWSQTDAGSTFILTEEEESLDVIITDAGIATYSWSLPAYIPEGVKAYTISATNNTHAITSEITGTIPANTGVIIEGTAAEYSFKVAHYVTEETKNTVADNKLVASVKTTNVEKEEGFAYYVLSKDDEGNVGLYQPELDEAEGTAFQSQANKAYLKIGVATGNNAIQYFSFDFGGGTTGIEGIEAEGAVNGKIYDITGREVKAITAPGIYIVNGAKVVVK